MRPYTTPALGSVTISDPVKVDYAQHDFNIGLSLNVVSGTNTSSVQYSLDDPDAVYATDYNTDAFGMMLLVWMLRQQTHQRH